eukprot:5021245-Alexandrium_andersonii.AAC.1
MFAKSGAPAAEAIAPSCVDADAVDAATLATTTPAPTPVVTEDAAAEAIAPSCVDADAVDAAPLATTTPADA